MTRRVSVKIQVRLEREHRLHLRPCVDAVRSHGYDQRQRQATIRRHCRVQLQVQHRSEIDRRVKRRSNRRRRPVRLRGEKHAAKNDPGTKRADGRSTGDWFRENNRRANGASSQRRQKDPGLAGQIESTLS